MVSLERGREKTRRTERRDRRFFSSSTLSPCTENWKKKNELRYLTLVAAGLIVGIGLRAQPDSRLTTWARGEASKELASEE